ncbi:MAG TPA: tRNA uridine(34) 5-carboxymethylaminomethyl modification radical SAM/GNAT enzyme Elp3 [Candidatus Bipolaricaulota bacterium]|nr:tRNA uridine(34) 5-carboxymethylaminomethyl modification radical SAM/GNAT enzyme Elp3 [Candidatus Bipolaricaulota bacterium]
MSKDLLNNLLRILLEKKPKTHAKLNKIKRKFARDHRISDLFTNAEVLNYYQNLLVKKELSKDSTLLALLKKRAIRTLSGVAPVAVLTKSEKCPGECAYCPKEKDMPKSYLSNEPAVMRAIAVKFDPFRQVKVRIKALENNGHETDKIELIVMGGTWSCLKKNYQTRFIRRCFDAANGKVSADLADAQKSNEKAKHRIIGLTLETRPDLIDEKEIKRFRELGCTKVEMGVQSVFDDVLKKNKRGHGRKEIIEATKLLKNAGFKVVYHMMPNLPGSTLKKDLGVFKEIFSNPDFAPDMIKIYPCVVVKGSLLYDWWKKGKFKPYSTSQLIDLLCEIKKLIPEYVRVIRLIRDIPAESIEAGNRISNLRQYLIEEMKKRGAACKCIRCREAREKTSAVKNAKYFVKKYKASKGEEYFLQYASSNKKTLYAFLRLRLPEKNEHFIKELSEAALIREVHTYGQMVPIDEKSKKAAQHLGLGKKLIFEAEKIAKVLGYDKMAVISGIGVRAYYRKLGYRLAGNYMSKKLK